MPRNKEIKFEDMIRGWVSVNSNNIDDKVLYKSDGMPTYHLANVVDDYCMKISHVIRGEEWLPSAPLHVYLYQVFNWLEFMPSFAHLPLILKPEGTGKLSKRDGDRLGFPVFPIDWSSDESAQIFGGYREKGFLKEGFVNMLAFLGWNPGTEQEIFSLEQLVQAFSIERVGKSGSKYDYSKTKWFNQQHLRLLSSKEIFKMLLIDNKSVLSGFSEEYILCVIELMKERAVFTQDVLNEGSYFFDDKVNYCSQAISKKWNKAHLNNVIDLTNELSNLKDFKSDSIESAFKSYIKSNSLSLGKIMPMLRIAVTGIMAGPSLFSTLELLGKDKMQERVIHAAETII
jgi:glutamyl-tRNA synthetase